MGNTKVGSVVPAISGKNGKLVGFPERPETGGVGGIAIGFSNDWMRGLRQVMVE